MQGYSFFGLPADCTLENVKLFDYLIPQVQKFLEDTNDLVGKRAYL